MVFSQQTKNKLIELKERFAEESQRILEDTYLKPFDGSPKADLYALPVERISHGAQHVTRVAGYIPILVEFCRSIGYPKEALQITDEEITLLQLAALFHDAARKNDKDNDIWEKESAALFKAYLEKNGITDVDALNFSKYITRQKKDILNTLLETADSLDIMRVKDSLQLEKVPLFAQLRAKKDRDQFIKLATDIRQLIADQHDLRDDCSIKYHDQIIVLPIPKTRDASKPERKQRYEHSPNCYRNTISDFSQYPHLGLGNIAAKEHIYLSYDKKMHIYSFATEDRALKAIAKVKEQLSNDPAVKDLCITKRTDIKTSTPFSFRLTLAQSEQLDRLAAARKAHPDANIYLSFDGQHFIFCFATEDEALKAWTEVIEQLASDRTIKDLRITKRTDIKTATPFSFRLTVAQLEQLDRLAAARKAHHRIGTIEEEKEPEKEKNKNEKVLHKADMYLSLNKQNFIFCFATEDEALKALAEAEQLAPKRAIKNLRVTKRTDIETPTPFSFRLNNAQFQQLKTEIILDTPPLIPPGDFAIKSLRADENCFVDRYIEMIVPVNGATKKHRLRFGDKADFTVLGNGIFRRKPKEVKEETKSGLESKENDFPVKQPQYTPQQKAGFSKAQSASLGTRDYSPPVFGFGQGGAHRDVLAGTLLEDFLFSHRLYIYDGGTVCRPTDFYSYEAAKAYFEGKKNTVLFSSSPQDLESFKEAISDPENKEKYNEALMRQRWNTGVSAEKYPGTAQTGNNEQIVHEEKIFTPAAGPVGQGEACSAGAAGWNINRTSKIFIGNDTVDSKLQAVEYARVVKKYLVEKHLVDQNHVVPIVYYTPHDLSLHFKPYLPIDHISSTHEAWDIFSNYKMKNEKYSSGKYQFLFALSSKVIEQELQKIYTSNESNDIKIEETLLDRLLRTGYIHILTALADKLNLTLGDLLSKFSKTHETDSPFAWYHLVRTRHYQEAEALLQKQKNIFFNKVNAKSESILLLAAKTNDLTLLNQVIAKKVDPNIQNATGETALSYAAWYNNLSSVNALLECPDINPILAESNGDTPFHCATNKGNPAMKQVFAKAGVTNAQLLHIAVQKGRLERVKASIENNPLLLEQTDADGRTPLCLAVTNGHVSIAEYLLTKGAKVDFPDGEDPSKIPLHCAAARGNNEMVTLLLKKGAKPSLLKPMCIFGLGKITQNKLAIAGYIQKRENNPREYIKSFSLFGKRFNFGFSKQEKLAAANALKRVFIGGENKDILQPYLEKELNNGELGSIFKQQILSR